MPEPFVIAKLFDFSMNTVLKILSLVFKILLIVGVPVVAGWFVYATIIKPHTNPVPTTTVQSGGVSNTYQIKVGFGGCARIPQATDKK